MSEPALSQSRAWFPGIEALRGIAALTVVMHHSWSLSNQPHFPGYWAVEGFGTFGVNLFFLLSGFLLADTFWQKRPASIRVYAVRRFFRIAPAYYVNVVLLFLFFAPMGALFSRQGVLQSLANGTFTHYLFPDTSSSFNVNGALWTLTIEILLYAFLPLMALAFRAAPVPTFVFLVLLGIGWKLLIALNGDWLRAFYFGGNPGLDDGIKSLFIARQFIGTVPVFAMGIAIRWMVKHGQLDWLYRRLPQQVGVLSFLVLLIPSVLMLRLVEPASDFRNPVLFSLYDLGVVALLVPALVIAARPDYLRASVLRDVSTWLGERSYSIYIWHFPVVLAVYERGPLLGPPPEGGYWWRLPVILAITLVLAAASYAAVERPGQAYGRRLADRLKSRSPRTDKVDA